MTNATAPARYSAAAQLFHWIIAALIVVQFSLAWTADDLPLGARKLALLAWHRRLGHAPPPLPAGMSKLERTLARLSHATLYGLIFIMPLTGWMMSSAKNYSVSWFGLFTWPNLIARNETAFQILRNTHDALSVGLLSIAVLHLLAALKHHFWNRDDVLVRMLPFRSARRP